MEAGRHAVALRRAADAGTAVNITRSGGGNDVTVMAAAYPAPPRGVWAVKKLEFINMRSNWSGTRRSPNHIIYIIYHSFNPVWTDIETLPFKGMSNGGPRIKISHELAY